MSWIVGFLLIWNLVLIVLLNKALEAVGEWMDAMRDLHLSHQHEQVYGDPDDGLVMLSGPVVGSDVTNTEGDATSDA